MERRTAGLPPPSASLQRRCWPHWRAGLPCCPSAHHFKSCPLSRRCHRIPQLQLVAAVVWSVTIFFSSMPCSSRCYFCSLLTLLASPTRSSSARCSSTTCSSVGGIFYNITGILSSAAEVLCSPSNSRHIISEHTRHVLILPCTSFQSPSHVHTSATPSRTPFPH